MVRDGSADEATGLHLPLVCCILGEAGGSASNIFARFEGTSKASKTSSTKDSTIPLLVVRGTLKDGEFQDSSVEKI